MAQTTNHQRVKIKKTPDADGTDNIVAIRSNGLILKSTLTLDDIQPQTALIENIVSPLDPYYGTRIKPVDAQSGFFQTSSINGATGYVTENLSTGNNAYAGLVVKGVGASGFDNIGSLQHFSPNYFVPYLQNNTILYTSNDLYIVGGKSTSDITFSLGQSATPNLNQVTEVLKLAADRTVTVPALTDALINSGGAQSLITKGYFDSNSGGDYRVPETALSSVATPETGEIILDTEDLNNFKYYNGTDWKSTNSGFVLATSSTGEINETRDITRDGKTSFGGDDPDRQVEILGDFKSQLNVTGNGQVTVESGDGIMTDLGHTTEFTGNGNTYLLDGTGEYAASFNGKINLTTVFDLISMHGVGKGGSFLAPTDYARMVAFRANPATNGGSDRMVLDLESRNGTEASKLRVRSSRLEFDEPVILTHYGNGNNEEGDTYTGEGIGTQTIGAPVYNLSVDTNGRLVETSISETSSVKITLTDAQMKTIRNVPIDIIPSPGGGKFIEVLAVTYFLDYGTTAFDYGGANRFYIEFETAENPLYELRDNVLNNTSDTYNSLVKTGLAGNNVHPGEPLRVRNLNDDPTVGDSTVNLYIQYRIVTL